MKDTPTFIIEKNIEVPDWKNRKVSIFRSVAQQMEIGDSVLVFTKKQREALVTKIKSFGFRAATRTIVGQGFRVWKLNKKITPQDVQTQTLSERRTEHKFAHNIKNALF